MFYLSLFKSVENRGFLPIRGAVREKGEAEKTNGSPSYDPDLNEEDPCIK